MDLLGLVILYVTDYCPPGSFISCMVHVVVAILELLVIVASTAVSVSLIPFGSGLMLDFIRKILP